MIKKLDREKLLIGVLVGLLLLVIAVPLPGGTGKEQENSERSDSGRKTEETGSTEARLREILGKISGVGAVEVFITYEGSGRVVVEKDESLSNELIREADSSGGNRTTTTTESKQETVYGNADQPYVIQQLTPKVEGVLVVAEGGGNAAVKRQIMETIKALFGLESHKISIMKMEVSK